MIHSTSTSYVNLANMQYTMAHGASIDGGSVAKEKVSFDAGLIHENESWIRISKSGFRNPDPRLTPRTLLVFVMLW